MSTPAEVSEKPTGDTYRTRAVAILNDACGSQELWGFHDVGIYGVVDTAASEIDSLQSRVAVLEEALKKIRAMKPEPIGDSGFQHGPALLFGNCKRIARDALTQSSGERREVGDHGHSRS